MASSVMTSTSGSSFWNRWEISRATIMSESIQTISSWPSSIRCRRACGFTLWLYAVGSGSTSSLTCSYCLTHETNSSFTGEKNRRIGKFGQCLVRLMRRSLTEGSKLGRFSAMQISNQLSQCLNVGMLSYHNEAVHSRCIIHGYQDSLIPRSDRLAFMKDIDGFRSVEMDCGRVSGRILDIRNLKARRSSNERGPRNRYCLCPLRLSGRHAQIVTE